LTATFVAVLACNTMRAASSTVVAYLPNEKMLFAGDIDVPTPGQAPSQALWSLFQNVDRLKLDFDRFVTARHGPALRVELVKLAQESN